MKRFLVLLLAPALLLLASCHKVPDHAKYIPNNAKAVISVNLKALARKVAWSKITGSPLLDSLEARMKQAGGTGDLKDMEHTGVRLNTTLYAFVPGSTPASASSIPAMTAILPLENAGEWEGYLKKAFPASAIVTKNDVREVRLGDNLFAAWDSEVAFMRAGYRAPGAYRMLPDSTEEWAEGMPDAAKTFGELEGLFGIKKDESVVKDKRFTALEKDGNDVSLWVNYDAAMEGKSPAGMMGGLGNGLWQGSAMATGFNFEKGRIHSEMRYYTPEGLKEAYAELGKGSVPESMMRKASGQGLDAMLAWNLSPKGVRIMLEKIGLLGLANLGLAAQGLNTDDVLQAFSGDMLVAVNHFTVPLRTKDSATSRMTTATPQFDYVVAMKLADREKFNKILSFLTGRQFLASAGSNTFMAPGSSSNVFVVEGGYLVAAKTAGQARTFISGSGHALPKEVKDADHGGPTSIYINAQSLMNGVAPGSFKTPRELSAFNEMKKLFGSVSFGGGSFHGKYVGYEGKLELVNKEENALVQLIDFASKMSVLRNQNPGATPMPTAAR
jgi:hypothetical protein